VTDVNQTNHDPPHSYRDSKEIMDQLMRHVDCSVESLETKINKRFISEFNHML